MYSLQTSRRYKGFIYFEDFNIDHDQQNDIDEIMNALFLQEDVLAIKLSERFNISSGVETKGSQEEMSQD